MNWCRVFALLILVHIHTSLAIPTLSGNSSLSKNDKKIVCHYHLHTFYDPSFRDYSSDVIDENQCTHVVYTDRILYRNFTVTPGLHDGKKKFYQRVVEMRKKGIHVSISFFKLKLIDFVRSLSSNERTSFVTALVAFMDEYNFDGFDLFWGCRFCLKNDTNENSMDLLRQLSDAFEPRGWLLSALIVPNKTVIDGLDTEKMSEYLDWITVRTVDLSEKSTAHAAPLYAYPGDKNDQLNSNWSINYLIEKGISSQKIVMPIASIGATFRLSSAQENGLNAPANQRSSEQFYEICNLIKSFSWTVVHDTNKRIGSYAYRGDQWISYDDVEDAQIKAEYIVQMNLGGGSIFNINGDDFEEKCGCGKRPLLTVINQVLRNASGPKIDNCT